jgi:polygalacturonase
MGNGVVDGDGYMWWWREIFVKNPAGRPIMVRMTRCRDVLVEGITWSNSPKFHFYVQDIDSFIF